MKVKHFGIIHFIDMVTTQYNDIFWIVPFNESHILINGIGSSLIPGSTSCGLIRRQNMHTAMHLIQIPRLSIPDILIQYQRLILRQYSDGIHTRIGAIGERKINNTIFSAIRNCWFCHFLCQCIQTAALPACQKHSDTFFLDFHSYSS